MDLWDSFSERISTIYLPDRKRPMLPTILSDALCSLLEEHIRFCFALDIYVKNGKIERTQYVNCSINVNKNHEYGKLENCLDYQTLFKCIAKMNKIEGQEYIVMLKDSHDIIAYLMILMNCYSGKKLEEYKCGIFRSIQLNEKSCFPSSLPTNIQKFLKGWNSSGGKYVH